MDRTNHATVPPAQQLFVEVAHASQNKQHTGSPNAATFGGRATFLTCHEQLPIVRAPRTGWPLRVARSEGVEGLVLELEERILWFSLWFRL